MQRVARLMYGVVFSMNTVYGRKKHGQTRKRFQELRNPRVPG